MERAPGGSPVGVDDPYAHVDRCDHVTDDGRCRWALERDSRDPAFVADRRRNDFRCPVVASDVESNRDSSEIQHGDWSWSDCPHFRSLTDGRTCLRCGLEERRLAHDDARPLLEEHHLSYADREDGPGHEITVSLCRWCHAKVHNSWARIDDSAQPDPDALAVAETRKHRETEELSFESASERFDYK